MDGERRLRFLFWKGRYFPGAMSVGFREGKGGVVCGVNSKGGLRRPIEASFLCFLLKLK